MTITATAPSTATIAPRPGSGSCRTVPAKAPTFSERLRAAIAAGPAALYDLANVENDAARARAKEGRDAHVYDLVTDYDGDVWVIRVNPDNPHQVEAAYLQGTVTRRRTTYGEPVLFPVCMCPAHRTVEMVNRALFEAGYTPFVHCKHGFIQEHLEAEARRAQVTVTPGERVALAIAAAAASRGQRGGRR